MRVVRPTRSSLLGILLLLVKLSVLVSVARGGTGVGVFPALPSPSQDRVDLSHPVALGDCLPQTPHPQATVPVVGRTANLRWPSPSPPPRAPGGPLDKAAWGPERGIWGSEEGPFSPRTQVEASRFQTLSLPKLTLFSPWTGDRTSRTEARRPSWVPLSS